MDQLLFKVINYEEQVFNNFVNKRNEMLSVIKKIEINKLDNSQLLIFINDIKSIIDPINLSTQNIEYLFTNLDFKKNNSIQDFTEIQKMLIIYRFFLSNGTSLPELESLSEV